MSFVLVLIFSAILFVALDYLCKLIFGRNAGGLTKKKLAAARLELERNVAAAQNARRGDPTPPGAIDPQSVCQHPFARIVHIPMHPRPGDVVTHTKVCEVCNKVLGPAQERRSFFGGVSWE